MENQAFSNHSQREILGHEPNFGIAEVRRQDKSMHLYQAPLFKGEVDSRKIFIYPRLDILGHGRSALHTPDPAAVATLPLPPGESSKFQLVVNGVFAFASIRWETTAKGLKTQPLPATPPGSAS
jgi:hypothetical protein